MKNLIIYLNLKKKKIFSRFLVNLRIFYGNFIIIFVDFKHLDPDPYQYPLGKINADPCESGSAILEETITAPPHTHTYPDTRVREEWV